MLETERDSRNMAEDQLSIERENLSRDYVSRISQLETELEQVKEK